MDGTSGKKHRKRKWKSKEGSGSDISGIESLQSQTGLSSLALRVCLQRGLETAHLIESFLSPKFDQLTHPSCLKDMEIAVARIAEARRLGQKIRIYGDYDVDGTTGAALLSWVFREFGILYDAVQPDRFKEGYGLHPQAIDQALEAGAALLLTVDCGITSFDAADKAKNVGLDLVVIDHHQIDQKRGLPSALAIVNPQREDCGSGLKQLCGCGLAFYLAMALRIKGREEGWFFGQAEPNLKQHLDLVVMATAADLVPLTGDNHILIKYGLEVLKHTKKPGIKALFKVCGLGSKDLSPSHLGFVLGPRINASGRMASASLALELLTTEDSERAEILAGELEAMNAERIQVQNEIWDQVRSRVEDAVSQGKFQGAVVICDPAWHEGVLGIVASKVVECFHRPAIVLTAKESFLKGSVRSFGGKDVLQALIQSQDLLAGFGGHRHAAGVSLKKENLDSFIQRFDEACAALPEGELGSDLLVEGECGFDELSLKSLEELEKLGPFGPGNPEPIFVVKATPQDHRILKGRHLKLSLAQKGTTMEAIWFHGAERADFQASEESEFAAIPELNRYQGRVKMSLRVRDWRRIEGNT